MALVIREIEIDDAPAYLNFLNTLDHETRFLLFEPGERGDDAEAQAEKLKAMKSEGVSTIFIALAQEAIIGFAAVSGNGLQRVKHRASVVVGILAAHRGMGWGKRLLLQAEEWAAKRGILRLEATVAMQNTDALWLYSGLGYHVEGIRRRARFVDGQYVDEFYMSKMLRPD